MTPTTDINSWLDACDLDDDNKGEIEQLYFSVKDFDEDGDNYQGPYTCKFSNGQFFVECPHCDVALRLATESARDAFLSIMQTRFPFLS